jgi:hypothetical protein
LDVRFLARQATGLLIFFSFLWFEPALPSSADHRLAGAGAGHSRILHHFAANPPVWMSVIGFRGRKYFP